MAPSDDRVSPPSPDRARVVLADATGLILGEASKRRAHEDPGLLHHAFSVFLFDHDDRVLLQRRALDKYHFPGAWANACCSHPQPGESTLSSASARVGEELRLRSRLTVAGSFLYRARCPQSGLIEHEFDTVFVGVTEEDPDFDPAEVCDFRWMPRDAARRLGPADEVVPWFAQALALIDDVAAVQQGLRR